MSSIIVALHPKWAAVHMLADRAHYAPRSGRIIAFRQKVRALGNWGLLSGTGDSRTVEMFAEALQLAFGDWDSCAMQLEQFAPRVAAVIGESVSSEIYLAGVSAVYGPQAFAFRTSDELPPETTREQAEASPLYAHKPFQPVPLPLVSANPPITLDELKAAGFGSPNFAASPDEMIWLLRGVAELQRQCEPSRRLGTIGGGLDVGTVTGHGVTIRELQAWPEDGVGALIRPRPIDWPRWHRENPRPSIAPDWLSGAAHGENRATTKH